MRKGGLSASPTGAPLIVFDGVCLLCSGFVQWVIRNDPLGEFRFTSAQGVLGQAIYRDLNLDPVRFETSLLVVDGRAYAKSAAIIETAVRLGGVWRVAGVLRWAPGWLCDGVYGLIARNRYALFGRRDACWLPPAEVADRFI